MQEYESFWRNPKAASHSFVIQMLLVLATGVTFISDEDESQSLRTSSAQWISTAHLWLSAPPEKSRFNLSGLQTHCLLLLAREVSGCGGDTIWISSGALLTTAMHLGLHIEPSRSPDIEFFETEMRRRIWHTVLELVVQSSIDAGAVPLITSDDFNTKLPSNINDDQMDEHTQTIPVAKPLEHYTEASAQILLARSLTLRLEIARFINDYRGNPTYDETLNLAARLSSFCRDNNKLFQSFANSQSRLTGFQKKLIDLLTQRFLLGLHHPFVVHARSSPQFYFSRKEALEIALSIISPLTLTGPTCDGTRRFWTPENSRYWSFQKCAHAGI